MPKRAVYDIKEVIERPSNQTAQRKMTEAMARLKQLSLYYWVMLDAVEKLPCDETITPTLGVSESKFYYNPDFIESIDIEELLFIFIHELNHIGMRHVLRGRYCIPSLWNIATDLYINENIMREFDLRIGETKEINGIRIKTPTDGIFAANQDTVLDMAKDIPEVLYRRLYDENKDRINKAQQGQQGQSGQSGGQGQSGQGQQGQSGQSGGQGQSADYQDGYQDGFEQGQRDREQQGQGSESGSDSQSGGKGSNSRVAGKRGRKSQKDKEYQEGYDQGYQDGLNGQSSNQQNQGASGNQGNPSDTPQNSAGSGGDGDIDPFEGGTVTMNGKEVKGKPTGTLISETGMDSEEAFQQSEKMSENPPPKP